MGRCDASKNFHFHTAAGVCDVEALFVIVRGIVVSVSQRQMKNGNGISSRLDWDWGCRFCVQDALVLFFLKITDCLF